MKHTAHAEWDTTGWWVITVPEIPGANSQCRRLDQVEANAREIIELMTGEAPEEVNVTWSVPGEAGSVAERVSRLRDRAKEIEDQARAETRRAVPTLRASGLSYRDIGTMTGMSYQRAQQIERELTRS
ncbi:MAG: type II toxin-antitoxin system HicB family antitoxin [Haloechinothrix sp.]